VNTQLCATLTGSTTDLFDIASVAEKEQCFVEAEAALRTAVLLNSADVDSHVSLAKLLLVGDWTLLSCCCLASETVVPHPLDSRNTHTYTHTHTHTHTHTLSLSLSLSLWVCFCLCTWYTGVCRVGNGFIGVLGVLSSLAGVYTTWIKLEREAVHASEQY
jgi:hypothetical protein